MNRPAKQFQTFLAERLSDPGTSGIFLGTSGKIHSSENFPGASGNGTCTKLAADNKVKCRSRARNKIDRLSKEGLHTQTTLGHKELIDLEQNLIDLVTSNQEQASKIYKKVKSTRHRFNPWFNSPQRLAYIHVVEVSHKGLGISFNPLLSHTYHQGNRWSVPLVTRGNTNNLGLPHKACKLPIDL